MRAMILERLGPIGRGDAAPLRSTDRDDPVAGEREIVLDVHACGVCHTELDEIEGRTPPSVLPIVPGHQVVGTVIARGAHAHRYASGDRVGVAWIFSACGHCEWCASGRENLCPSFRATGRDAHGGYAQRMVVHEDFAVRIPARLSDVQAAPLLCAGAVGYRALALTGIDDGMRLGLMGFGASAHLVLQLVRARFPHTEVSVFARDEHARRFALELGAHWAGDVEQPPPRALHAIIDTTPAWTPVLAALRALAPGGRLVINAIRKEDRDADRLRTLDYATQLWQEKQIQSVANVTREDVRAFLEIAATADIRPRVREFALEDANEALWELAHGASGGAKVLCVS